MSLSFSCLARLMARVAVAIVALGALSAHPAFAQVSASADVSAEIVSPLSLSKTEDLSFGPVAAGQSAGTVTIVPASGARSATGGATPVGVDFHHAEFQATAQAGMVTTVTLPASETTLSRAGGGASMTVTLEIEGPEVRVVPGSGTQTFRVGGTLHVGEGQPIGQYQGSFVLQLEYL